MGRKRGILLEARERKVIKRKGIRDRIKRCVGRTNPWGRGGATKGNLPMLQKIDNL